MFSEESDFAKRHFAAHWSGKQSYFNLPKKIAQVVIIAFTIGFKTRQH